MFSPANPISDKPPIISLVRIFATVVLGFVIVGPMLGVLATMSFYDGDLLRDIANPTPTPELRNALLVMQATVSFVGLIMLPVIHITQLERKSLKDFFPEDQHLITMLLVVAGIGLAFPIAMSPLAEWNLNIHFPEFMRAFEEWAREEEDKLAKVTAVFTNINTPRDLSVSLLVIALLPAIGEELVFRGLLQQEFWRSSKNIHVAIWLSAFVFSAIHMQFYGFIPRLLLGALFGYLYYWSGNLLVAMFAHFFNNAFAVVMVYLNNIKATSINVEDGESAPIQYVLACILLTGALLYYAMNHYKQVRLQRNDLPIR
ncbi:MAG: CPBP family intramembrane glutamic endopeptidase [Chryseolinea sp.]